MNAHDILGVPPTATPEELKEAYKRLAQIHHPDKNPDDPYAETRFRLIKEAYESLTDEGDPEGREERERARHILRDVFTQMMSQDDVQQPIAACTFAVIQGIDRLNANIIECQQKRSGFKRLKKQFKCGDKENILTTMLDDQIAQFDEAIKKTQEEIASANNALELLKEYSDVSPENMYVALGTSSSTTGSAW